MILGPQTAILEPVESQQEAAEPNFARTQRGKPLKDYLRGPGQATIVKEHVPLIGTPPLFLPW